MIASVYTPVSDDIDDLDLWRLYVASLPILIFIRDNAPVITGGSSMLLRIPERHSVDTYIGFKCPGN